MNSVNGLERLRASKRLKADQDLAQGVELGKNWALNNADYAVLERVADLDVSNEITPDEVRRAIAGNDGDWRDCNPFGDFPSNEMASGFVEGATEVLSQV